MIKSEVIFDGDDLRVSNFKIVEVGDYLYIIDSLGCRVKEMYRGIFSFEDAVIFCLQGGI